MIKAHDEAFRGGNDDKYKSLQNEFQREISNAKKKALRKLIYTEYETVGCYTTCTK